MNKCFNKALKKILEEGEYDKCIREAKGSEKRHLKKLKVLLEKSGNIMYIPLPALLYEIKSMILLKDILFYMLLDDIDEIDSSM